jgi:hypothetical protein
MKYQHLYFRVEYPTERGYRMESYPLPDWIHLTVERVDETTKQLVVHSRLHLNKKVPMLPVYSSDFSDADIIKDQSGKVHYAFLKV